ncbi:hypothetical protein A8H40_09160 [Burkholderia multivorans]|nr:hypothetical protein A8H40_09160 [Burkholderia multivorans]
MARGSRRTPNAERPTPNAQRPTPNAQRPPARRRVRTDAVSARTSRPARRSGARGAPRSAS